MHRHAGRLGRSFFLILVLALTPAYKFRCYLFCTDQTSTQGDYVEQRDRCRDYAQTKLDTASPDTSTDAARKTQLISYFSECMAQNGWSVPGDKDKDKDKADAKALTAAPAAAAPAVAAEEEDAWRKRAAECAFARQSADVSSVASARAEACDRECEQMLDAAPDAPPPAACGNVIDDTLEKGYEK